MKIYSIAITVITLMVSVAPSFAQTQFEMNQEAGNDYHKTDSELNHIYLQIINEYASDTAFIKNLKASQRIWIKFRDAELKMKFPYSYSYGSIQPMCVVYYLAYLTNERIKTLQEWIDGTEEGDGCAGSVRLKNH